MTPDIVTKLAAELALGINTEAQAVYMLSAIRKIIEHDKLHDQYPYLWFHSCWALHTSMDRGLAKTILTDFGNAHVSLSSGLELRDLPQNIGKPLEQISKMNKFKEELSSFLSGFDLPNVFQGNNWPRFLHLYGQIIEDCALAIKESDTLSVIIEIVVKMETAVERSHGQTYYKISWNIKGRDGTEGVIFVINSYFDDEDE
jgi:hypothetical protein